jgi:hypothetical protein
VVVGDFGDSVGRGQTVGPKEVPSESSIGTLPHVCAGLGGQPSEGVSNHV